MIGNAKYSCPECGKPVYQSHGKVKRHRYCQGKYIGRLTTRRHTLKRRLAHYNNQFKQPIRVTKETIKNWLGENA